MLKRVLFRYCVLPLALCLSLHTAWAAPERVALDMGVFPYFSTRALLDLYQPMRLHLARELNRPVNLFTALSFKVYADQTRIGAYDIVVTPPHLARLAQRETGYVPIVMFTRELRGVMVVARDSPIQNLQQLRGRIIATPNRLALVTIMGQQLLQESGLGANDVSLLEVASHNTAVLAVQRGEVDAAMTEAVALAQMPDALRNSVRIIARMPPAPHVMFLVHPRLGMEMMARIKRALLDFAATREGRGFFRDSGFEGVRSTDESDLKSVDPYQRELKRLLETAPP